jgi:hypothetical protein
VGASNFHAELLAILGDLSLDVLPLFENSLAAFDFFPIGRDFVDKVGRGHHLFIEKNVSVDERPLTQNSIGEGENLIAHIIDKGAIEVICGFSVEHDNRSVNVNHFFVFLSLTYK